MIIFSLLNQTKQTNMNQGLENRVVICAVDGVLAVVLMADLLYRRYMAALELRRFLIVMSGLRCHIFIFKFLASEILSSFIGAKTV